MATAAPPQYVSNCEAGVNKFPHGAALTSRGSFVQLGRHPKRRPAAGGRGVPQLPRDDRALLLSVRHHRHDRLWEPAGHGGALQGPSPAVSRRCVRAAAATATVPRSLKFGLVAPSHQKEEDQLLHRVTGICRLAGCRGRHALRRDRAHHRLLAVRRDLLPGSNVPGRSADDSVHPAPLLHRPGQVRVPTRRSPR